MAPALLEPALLVGDWESPQSPWSLSGRLQQGSSFSGIPSKCRSDLRISPTQSSTPIAATSAVSDVRLPCQPSAIFIYHRVAAASRSSCSTMANRDSNTCLSARFVSLIELSGSLCPLGGRGLYPPSSSTCSRLFSGLPAIFLLGYQKMGI